MASCTTGISMSTSLSRSCLRTYFVWAKDAMATSRI